MVNGVTNSAKEASQRVEESAKLLADAQRRLNLLLWVVIILSAASLLVNALRTLR
jgi:hypothetical protein